MVFTWWASLVVFYARPNSSLRLAVRDTTLSVQLKRSSMRRMPVTRTKRKHRESNDCVANKISQQVSGIYTTGCWRVRNENKLPSPQIYGVRYNYTVHRTYSQRPFLTASILLTLLTKSSSSSSSSVEHLCVESVAWFGPGTHYNYRYT